MRASGLILVLFGAAYAQQPPAPRGLMVDLTEIGKPAGTYGSAPRFSWIMESNTPNDVQTAYEIVVADRAGAIYEDQPPTWRSGKVVSDQSTAVPYKGPALKPATRYYWAVRIWDHKSVASPWSAAQGFSSQPESPQFTSAIYPPVLTPVAPVKIARLGEGHYFVDFGRAAFGSLQMDPIGGNDKREIIFHLGESLAAPSRVNRQPAGSVRYHRGVITVDGRGTPYTVPLSERDQRGIRPPAPPAMPFRYVEVENAPPELEPETLRQIAVHYPFDEDASRFTSSDPTLNAVWQLCKYTIKMTSFLGVYVDGDRERKPYEADAYINQLSHYAVDRDFTLARSSHEYLIRNPTWPTEWVLHSVLMAWADYLYTGDDRSLRHFYTELAGKPLVQLAREDGLISTATANAPPGMRDIVDWPEGERDGYEMRPINTVVNAFHFRALVLMGEIARVLGRADDASTYAARAAKVKDAINARLFDAARGVYVDGEGSTHASLHANAFPLALGVVPDDRRNSVAAFLASKGMDCSVYGAQYFLEALYEAGLGDRALAHLTSKGERSWAHMIYDIGSTVTLEAWDPKYKPNLDWNHAWGAAPANLIARKLMGVEPAEPAFRRIRIRPQPGSLKRASLDLPTIRGTVHVDFEQDARRAIVNVELPANTRAEVSWPVRGEFRKCGEFGSGKHRCEVNLVP